MNDIRRKLMAYFNQLNNDNMKPCIVYNSNNYGRRSIAVYCDDPQPTGMKEILKFLMEHVCIMVDPGNNIPGSGEVNIFPPNVYAERTSDTSGTLTFMNGQGESISSWNAFTGSAYDWNA